VACARTQATARLASPNAWLARGPARLAASLEEFVGHLAYGVAQLRDDLERFVFLLGGGAMDGDPAGGGEPLCGP
jgi:hypothetical protein